MSVKTLGPILIPLFVSAALGLPRQSQTVAAPPPGLPTLPGVYYHQGPAGWVRLEPAPVDGSEIKGLETFLETAGLSNLRMTFFYAGSQASLRISEPRPTFYVRGVGSAADALIVRLTAKKGRRAAETASTAAGVGNRAGFKKDTVHRVTAVSISDGLSSITADQDLRPGEYLLTLGSADAAYDFGITRAKR